MLDRHFGAKFVAIAPVYYPNLAGVVLGREGLADRNLCFRSQLTELTESQTWTQVDTQVYVSSNVGPGTKSRSVLIYFERLTCFF